MKTMSLKRTVSLLVAMSAAWGSMAHAAGTDAGVTISNTASVNYTVGGVPQTQVDSPAAQFVVDRKIDLNLIETDVARTNTTPGQTAVVTTFKLTNTGNGAQGYTFTAGNVGGTLFGNTDAYDVANLLVRVSGTACVPATTTTPAYAGETASTVLTLAEDACVYVFILADSPTSALNAQAANVRLTAITREGGSLADLKPLADAALLVADDPGTEQIVFADSEDVPSGNLARDGLAFATDQYYIVGPALVATKVAAVQADTLQPTNPKPIPGATVQYTITLTNSGAAPADAVAIGDSIPANTTFVCGSMTLNGNPVADPPNCATTPPASLTATVGTLSNVGPGNVATFVFRVTIN
ncbi:MAG: DUF11 domain-containing protein [Gammaproteobacteria bacterium]|nr:DUF11 domain-containing protein [Gammaproteobacteria bacterium]